MLLHTTAVTVLPDFRLQLSFNNGVAGEVCLLDELWGEMFEPLKDEALLVAEDLKAAQQTALLRQHGFHKPVPRE